MSGFIDSAREPTEREVRVFGALWLLFFAGVGAVAAWRPEGLIGGSVFLALAWIGSLLFNREVPLARQLSGVAIPALFGAVGGSLALGTPLRVVLSALGVVALGGALAVWASPAFGRRLYHAWMTAAVPLGFTISHLVLASVYYLVLTPIGLLMRAAGRDPMTRRFDRQADSYWVKRPARVDPGRYFRQF